jgi:G:T-mismatch repair DNA endonuclease (very short patch repair protein)
LKKKKRGKKKKVRRSTTISQGHNQVFKTLRKLGYKIRNEFVVDGLPYDIFIIDLNLIIEYNGDRWHYNKNIYSADFFDKVKNRYAWEKWEKDEKKLKHAKDNGYNIEVIWEYDWKRLSDRTRFLQKIVNKYDRL